MPDKPLSAFLLICQHLLEEKDGAFSAIRIVDLFFFERPAGVSIEQQAVLLHVFGSLKVPPSDEAEHIIQLNLIRPDGEVATLLGPKGFVFGGKFDDVPRGLNINAQIGVVPRQVGTHHIALLFDEQEVARAPFTLREQQPAEKSPE